MWGDVISFVSIHTRFFYTQIQHLTETSGNHGHTNGGKRFKFDDGTLPFELDTGCLNKGKYTLRKDWKLHMYISQLPCNLSLSLSLYLIINVPPLFMTLCWLGSRVIGSCVSFCRWRCFTQFGCLSFGNCSFRRKRFNFIFG